MVGDQSEALFTQAAHDALLGMLADGSSPLVQFHTIVALEKFAMTARNKEKILARGTVRSLLELEKVSPTGAADPRHTLQFCASWSLDNIFPSEGRDFTPREDPEINAILNPEDTSGYLKLSRSGFEVRNDALSFESVRGTPVVFQGKWYYEVTLCSPGVMQIGWATKHCHFDSAEGIGIGDNRDSFAYDGCRQRLWSSRSSVPFGKQKWDAGDVIGALLDLDQGTASFFLNGANQGNVVGQLGNLLVLSELAKEGLQPAASFMTYEHAIFNFGHTRFKHPPPENVKPLNEAGTLSEGKRSVIPRLAKSPALVIDFSDNSPEAEPACEICCEKPPNTSLVPCGHDGFCFECSIQFEKCPICRMHIHERKTAPA